jgi:hypothetical protein
MMKLKSLFGTLMVCSLSSAPAQIILQETYDTSSTPNGGNALAWSGGNIANTSVTYTDGAGVGGTRGVLFVNDFQQQWNGYIAYQYQNGSVTGNTDPNLSDYVVSFDLNVQGTPFNDIQLNVQSANAWPGPWAGTGAGAIPVSATTGFQHVSVNLANSSIWSADALNPTCSIFQLQFQLNGWQLAGGGPALGEQVALDNVTLALVPEPASLLLTGLGLAGWFLARRRN